MTKKVSFARAAAPKSADDWVAAVPAEGTVELAPPAEPSEPMKRLTIDVPRSLHTRIKAACALRGSKMVDEIRAMLEREFTDLQTR